MLIFDVGIQCPAKAVIYASFTNVNGQRKVTQVLFLGFEKVSTAERNSRLELMLLHVAYFFHTLGYEDITIIVYTDITNSVQKLCSFRVKHIFDRNI